MKLSKIFKNLITEKKGDTYDYGCVMLKLELPKEWWDKIQGELPDEDVYTKEGDRSYGREDEPHITIRYGTLETVTNEQVKDVLYSESRPKIEVTDISLFENEEFDVLKFDIKSEILNKLNDKFEKYSHESDFPNYHPHCTIAYLKSGTGKEIVEKLKNKFSLDVANDKIKPSSYLYSKSNGNKEEFELKPD